MSDDRHAREYIEKRLGHETYREPRPWGKIAIWLVVAVIVFGLLLYLIVGG